MSVQVLRLGSRSVSNCIYSPLASSDCHWNCYWVVSVIVRLIVYCRNHHTSKNNENWIALETNSNFCLSGVISTPLRINSHSSLWYLYPQSPTNWSRDEILYLYCTDLSKGILAYSCEETTESNWHPLKNTTDRDLFCRKLCYWLQIHFLVLLKHKKILWRAFNLCKKLKCNVFSHIMSFSLTLITLLFLYAPIWSDVLFSH